MNVELWFMATSLKLARSRFELSNLAPCRLAFVKIVPVRFKLRRSWPVKVAPVRFTPAATM